METQEGPIPHTDEVVELRPGWMNVLAARLEHLPAQDRKILERRILGQPVTLEVVGRDLGLTRERIRQIEARALRELVSPVNPAELAIIERALERLDELTLPVTETAFVGAGFAPLDDPLTKLLLAIANHRNGLDGNRPIVRSGYGRHWVCIANRAPDQLVAALLGPVCDGEVIEDLVDLWSALELELQAHCGEDGEAEAITADILEALHPVEVNGRHALWHGARGIAERARRIVRANGEPMTAEAVKSFFEPRVARQVENALCRRDLFVVTGRGLYGVAEFGLPAMPKLRDLVRSEVAEHGQVAVSYLEGKAETLGFSRTSVRMYCRDLPDLIEQGGVVRRRGPNDAPGVGAPECDRDCLRVLDGRHRGQWATLVHVDHHALYTHSQRFPKPIAGAIDLELGERKVPLMVSGWRVRATFVGQYPYLLGGELRPVLDALGFADGQEMRMVAAGHMALELEPVHPPEVTLSPFRMLVVSAGLYDIKGDPLPDGDVLEALAFAIGFDEEVPASMLRRRLRERKDQAVLIAYNQIVPER